MTQTRFWQFLKSILLVFILGGGGTLFLFTTPWDNTPKQVLYLFLYNGTLWVVLWHGNSLVNEKLGKYLSWIETPVRSLLLALGATLIFTVIAAVLVFGGFLYLISGAGPSEILNSVSPGFIFNLILITLVVTLFLYGRGFLIDWKESFLEAERLKQENLLSRYESLKSQIDPHFLFNSLNVLSTLVYKDQDKAARFIRHLSEVYRYVLAVRDREVVGLDEELNVLDAYSYLLKMRFGENLHISMDVKPDPACKLAPLSLQMLLENAIKHNVIGKNRPLYIHISRKGDTIVVSNNLQKKDLVTDSAGIGLANITKRYQYLSDRPVDIRQKEGRFSVGIPLLTVQ